MTSPNPHSPPDPLKYDPEPEAGFFTVFLIIFLLAGLGGPIFALAIFWML